jgi:nucleoside-diphosphate-sugar epimerase
LTQKLVIASRDAGIEKFILASSHAVYGLSPPVWSESRLVAPASLHGLAKRAQELMCEAAGAGCVALRLAKLVGPSPQFRVDASELPHVLVAKSLERSPVVLEQPDQRLDLLDVRDAAGAILAVIECQFLHQGVFNVGAGEHVTARVVAEVVARVAPAKGLRLDCRLSPVTRPSRAFGMSIDRISGLVGWKPSIDLERTVYDLFDSAILFKNSDKLENKELAPWNGN